MRAQQTYRRFRTFIDQPANFFLVVGGVFVVLFALLTPPLQVLDEHSHFYRIIEISRGWPVSRHIATQNGVERYGNFFPRGQINEIESLVRGADKTTGNYDTGLFSKYLLRNDPDQSRQIAGFEGSALYTPIVYTPQAVAYKVSGAVIRPTLLRMYAARLANALCWLLLIYWAIGLLPVGKWTLTVIALLPINLFLGGSLSADASVTGLCFLLLAYILYLRQKNQMLAGGQIIRLGTIMALIALSKSAYYPILLSIFFIPWRLWPRKRLVLPFLLGIPLCLSMLWGAIVRPIAFNLHRAFDPTMTTSPADQLSHALSHPFAPVFALFNSVFSGFSDFYIRDILGTFSWIRIILPLWVQAFSAALIILALCYQLGRTKDFVLPKLAKWLAVGLIIGTFCLINLTFYFLWGRPTDRQIGDVQGRYFLPLLVLLIPLFTSSRRFIIMKEKTFVRTMQLGSLMLLLIAFTVIMQRFY